LINFKFLQSSALIVFNLLQSFFISDITFLKQTFFSELYLLNSTKVKKLLVFLIVKYYNNLLLPSPVFIKFSFFDENSFPNI